MKLQKTLDFASIYLLTILALLFGSVILGGCTEPETQKQQETPSIQVENVFDNLKSLLIGETEESLPNGTISRSQWSFEQEDCHLIITEKLSYKRTQAPFGGFNGDAFVTAWQSKRQIPLAQIDAKLLQQKGLYIRIHILDNQNLINEESQYTEAYLAYYKAENGQTHLAKTNHAYNLINLPIQEEGLAPEVIEELKRLIIHCQAN